jgi:hypothetical protein
MVAAIALLLSACAGPSSSSAPAPTATLTAGWLALQQRPLKLPRLASDATCPFEAGHGIAANVGNVQGQGPVYAFWSNASTLGVMQSNVLQQVAWYIDPSYTGPVLVRGRQLDGSGVLTFHGGLDQASYHGDWAKAPNLPALRLMADAHEPAWAPLLTWVNVPGEGCYGYQVDGSNFSYIIVFLGRYTEY